MGHPALFEFKVSADGLEHCSYCGSLKPEQAYDLMATSGVGFSGSDWKYGWPHKFYFEVPNPYANVEVEMGRRYAPDITAQTAGVKSDDGHLYQPIMGFRRTIHCKFYNTHLNHIDAGFLAKFSERCDLVFGVRFTKDDKGLMWNAVPNRQLYGVINPDGTPGHGRMF